MESRWALGRRADVSLVILRRSVTRFGLLCNTYHFIFPLLRRLRCFKAAEKGDTICCERNLSLPEGCGVDANVCFYTGCCTQGSRGSRVVIEGGFLMIRVCYTPLMSTCDHLSIRAIKRKHHNNMDINTMSLCKCQYAKRKFDVTALFNYETGITEI